MEKELSILTKILLVTGILYFMLKIILTLMTVNITIYDVTDKYNLNPHPVCAPASLNGKTVTNCIQK